MTVDATKVRVAVSGALMSGLTSATAPTGTAGTTTGFTDLGGISEDGVTMSFPSAGDSKPIKVWQNGQTVRVIRTASDDNPTFKCVLVETKLETVQLALGVTVTQTATEGSFELDTTDVRSHNSFVLDVVDGAELIRTYIPYGIVTEVGDLVFKNDEPVGYEITIEAERDATKAYNVKTWATALKTP